LFNIPGFPLSQEKKKGKKERTPVDMLQVFKLEMSPPARGEKREKGKERRKKEEKRENELFPPSVTNERLSP
jgi:hypothetical protein